MPPHGKGGYEIAVEGPGPKLPHNCKAIMKRSELPGCGIPTEKLHEHLCSGVFLDQKRQKYWVEPKTGYNSFMLFARGLSITWGDDKRYWEWASFRETSNVLVEIAELIDVCWLEVRGKLDTSYLTPGVMYEVAFVVMLKEANHGWDVPVNLELILPDGKKQERKEVLHSKHKAQWMELPVGEFWTCQDMDGDMHFSLVEIKNGQWKSGLVIKGVIVRPKSFCNNHFTVVPKDLSITWGEDKRYWDWYCLDETSNVLVEVAELLNVCWLEAKGTFNTSKLSAGITYEVVFVVMLKDPASGWEVPVNLRLVHPDGKMHERKESLLNKPKGKWIEIKVGEFKKCSGNTREIQFSLFEIEGGQWKKGLIIKSVVIRPKH